jgi:hypothetical protein
MAIVLILVNSACRNEGFCGRNAYLAAQPYALPVYTRQREENKLWPMKR